MRRAILLSILLLLPASLAAAESLKLGLRNPVVGEKWSEETDISASMTITPKGKSPIPTEMKEVGKKNAEVLAVKDGTIVKARITYEKHAKSEKLNGRDKGVPSKIQGKTYTLTAGNPVTVEPSGEADEVRNEEKRFGKPDRLRIAIAGREYPKGKTVELKPEDASDTFGDPEKFNVAKFTLEYTGMVGKHAKFALAVTMTGKQGSPIDGLTMAMKGSVLVDVATAHPVEIDVTGQMTQDNAAVKVEGTMRMIGRRTVAK